MHTNIDIMDEQSTSKLKPENLEIDNYQNPCYLFNFQPFKVKTANRIVSRVWSKLKDFSIMSLSAWHVLTA